MNADSRRRVTVTKLDKSVPDILHRHYDFERGPQPCHVALDLRDGQMSAGYNPEIGDALPVDVHNRRIRWWTIPCLTAADANRLLRELAPLARRVLADSSIKWNGHARVGVLGPDAEAAEQEISDLIADQTPNLEHVVGLNAGDWFSERGLPVELTADTTDARLAEIAAEQERKATKSGPDAYTVLLNAEGYLRDSRELLRQRDRDELQTVVKDLASYKERRDKLIVRLASFGDSRAEIAALARLTPAGVGTVLRRMTGGRPRPRPATQRRGERDDLKAIAEALASTRQCRNNLIVRLAAYGDSDRAIAPLASLSKTSVGNIRKRMAKAGQARHDKEKPQ